MKPAMFFLSFSLLLLFGCKSSSSNGGSSSGDIVYDYDITAAASRTSGVAPLCVHFNADIMHDATNFHNNDYTWNFGDASSGTWGTTGKSKNTAKGAIAAHVFETAGTYTVTLTVKDATGVIGTNSFTITVADPDTVYSGNNTICVSSAGDFTDAPSNALQITTTDLSTITGYATAGKRILFRRGDSWTTTGLTWPNNAGPVTIGAYGTKSGEDAMGICTNSPAITVDSDDASGSFLPMDNKQDWRIMDLRLINTSRAASSIGGSIEMQRNICLRLKVEGFLVGLGCSHWNSANLMMNDQIAFVSCDVSDSGMNIFYLGSERLVFMGNKGCDARTSHVVRVWQSYLGIISNNLFSGASLDNTNGRAVLKFHGPKQSEIGPADGTLRLAHRSELTIVSDNVFGASGPWPMGIGPQDSGSDERLAHIIFERNRYYADYGSVNTDTPLQTVLRVMARYITVRNNVFDGSNNAKYFTGIHVLKDGIEPAPLGVALYNNTIYKSDNSANNDFVGILVESAAKQTIVMNNLVSFPASGGNDVLILNYSSDLNSSNNLLSDSPGFTDPDNATPLSRDFSLSSGSAAINAGVTVPVYEDINGNARSGMYDIGAYDY